MEALAVGVSMSQRSPVSYCARDDDETVESLWSDWDIPRRMMQACPVNALKSCLQVALWIKEKNEETGEQPSKSMFQRG